VPNYATQTQNARSWAAFGSLNYAVNDRLKLRGGLRYTSDKKDFVAQRIETTGRTYLPLSDDSTNISWDASGTYVVNRDTNVFVRVATGYRAPSMQGRLNDLPASLRWPAPRRCCRMKRASSRTCSTAARACPPRCSTTA
jgi:iron complex outermembrane receptor protein